MILLTCGILSIFRYKKSEVNIQMKTEAWVSKTEEVAEHSYKKKLWKNCKPTIVTTLIMKTY